MALLVSWTHWAAVGAEIALLARTGLKPLEYTNAPAKIPNYPAGKSWGTLGNAFDQMQLPLSPEESARHIVTLPGSEAKLWAADPDITKPICMAWDERGRLWSTETVDYPNELQKPGEAFGKAILAADLLKDPDAQVRLSAFLALTEMPPSDQIGAAAIEYLAPAPHQEAKNEAGKL